VSNEWTGLLCIGDPHLASRVPGFRKDDYPRAILGKLTWAFNYAREHNLLPVILEQLSNVVDGGLLRQRWFAPPHRQTAPR
jgi:hypothetical protein